MRSGQRASRTGHRGVRVIREMVIVSYDIDKARTRTESNQRTQNDRDYLKYGHGTEYFTLPT